MGFATDKGKVFEIHISNRATNHYFKYISTIKGRDAKHAVSKYVENMGQYLKEYMTRYPETHIKAFIK